MENEKVIEEIKTYMVANRLNQTQLANKLSISSTQVSRWFRTKRIGNTWIRLLKIEGIIN
jgi:hypothetical protein